MQSPMPPLSLCASVAKPKKVVAPLAAALAWGNDPDYIYQEKMDGRFAVRTFEERGEGAETTLAGELMPDGTFWAFDCLTIHGIDIRHHPYSDRYTRAGEIFAHSPRLNPQFKLLPPINYQPTILNQIWACGGEGIVRKRLDSPWGTPMEACKRLETFYCLITAMGTTQSVEISRIVDGLEKLITDNFEMVGRESSRAVPPSTLNPQPSTHPCGSVKLGGGKCDRVREGSILKVEGFGLTATGQIREPRPCKDTPTTWLVKY
jgi:hypothetical protein